MILNKLLLSAAAQIKYAVNYKNKDGNKTNTYYRL